MRLRLTIAALVVCLAAFAQQSITVDQLVAFMRSAIQNKQQDKQVAEYVKRMKLTQKLDDRTIEELQSEGLGPKTVAALKMLAALSTSLPEPATKKVEPPAPKVEEPPPSPEQQKKILDEAREYALNYTKSLPNFICAQYTKRYQNDRQYSSLLAKLTYFEQHEKYDTVTVNDKPSKQPYESIGGSISTGEFGSMLRGIFDPMAEAQFRWYGWRTHNGHKAYVFRFDVDQPHSQWQIEDRDSHTKISPAYNGLVYINVQDNTILAFTQQAVDLPSTFRVTEADTKMDYDTAEISGVPFVLPSRAVMHMKSGSNDDQKNEITFHHYQKYSADATLSFGDIAPDTPSSAPEKK